MNKIITVSPAYQEEVDQVEEEPDVEGLLVVLHVQRRGHDLGDPGEAEHREDLGEHGEVAAGVLGLGPGGRGGLPAG